MASHFFPVGGGNLGAFCSISSGVSATHSASAFSSPQRTARGAVVRCAGCPSPPIRPDSTQLRTKSLFLSAHKRCIRLDRRSNASARVLNEFHDGTRTGVYVSVSQPCRCVGCGERARCWQATLHQWQHFDCNLVWGVSELLPVAFIHIWYSFRASPCCKCS